MTAWLDYIDARRRLIHEWKEQGIADDEISIRIQLEVEQVAVIARQPTDPPFPGSARFQLIEWRRRVEALESELHAAVGVPSKPPVESQFRALVPHIDPECCGCQYWTDHPRPGQHHPRCMHAPQP